MVPKQNQIEQDFLTPISFNFQILETIVPTVGIIGIDVLELDFVKAVLQKLRFLIVRFYARRFLRRQLNAIAFFNLVLSTFVI